MATDGIPVVTVAAGGLPVSVAPDGYGIPVTESPLGMGLAITVVAGAGGGGMAITYAGVATLTLGGQADGGSITVADNLAVNDFIATIAVTGGTGTYTFTETSDPDNKFTVSGSTLRTSALLNWATDASHPVTIQASNGTDTISASFTILVTDFVAPVASTSSTPDTLDNTPTIISYFTTGGANPTLVGDQLRIYKDGVVVINATLDAGQIASGYSITLGPYADGVYVFTTRIYRPASAVLSTQFPPSGITLTIDVYATNTVAPVISGSAPYGVGTVLSCTTGTWATLPTVTGYSYQWKRGGTSISGATTSTYTLVAADHNVNITCTVAGITAAGAGVPVASNTIATGSWAPTNTVAPAVTGAPGIGTLLTCGTGTWTQSPSSYAYQWLRDGATISGATASTYTTVVADDDTDVSCRVTATNTYGTSVAVDSNALAISSGGTTTVTAPNGQWWTFTGSLTNGSYLDGSPWVYCPTASTIEIEAISTMPTGSGTTARHGGMINPTFNTLVESSPGGFSPNVTGHTHGYDGRVVHANTWIYSDAYNAHASFPIEMAPGQTLVSCVSNSPASATVPAPNPEALQKMACVTVVDYIPYADEFRPNYFGPTKIRKRWSDVDLTDVPELSSISPFNPKGDWFEGFHLDTGSIYVGGDATANTIAMNKNSFRDLQYWILPFGADGTLMRPSENQYTYPDLWGKASGTLATYVLCDFGDGDRVKFIKRIIQVAIDAYAVALGAGFSGLAPWAGGAGFYFNPLWFIRFSGLILDDTGMKNAVTISTTKVDYYSVPIHKWGSLNNKYLSTDAHAQYYRVPGEDYTAGFPLYGDRPATDVTSDIGANHTPQDPGGVYDMVPYKGTYPGSHLPYDPSGTNPYPDILDTCYETWHRGSDGAEVDYMGNYMRSHFGIMGDTLASIAMGDEDFWALAEPAYLPWALRYYWDAQLWSGWGVNRDYSDGYSAPKMYFRDVYACGGTGSGWFLTMWEEIYGVAHAPALGPEITALSPVDGLTTVALDASLTVTFDENIQFGTGDINIYKSSDDTLFENFDVVTHAGTKLTISGAVLTINPAGTMAGSTGYYVQIDATAIESVATDEPFAGILDETTWNFTTVAAGYTETWISFSGSYTPYLYRTTNLSTDAKTGIFFAAMGFVDTSGIRNIFENGGSAVVVRRNTDGTLGLTWRDTSGAANITMSGATVLTAERALILVALDADGTSRLWLWHDGAWSEEANDTTGGGVNLDFTNGDFVSGGNGPYKTARLACWTGITMPTIDTTWLATNFAAAATGLLIDPATSVAVLGTPVFDFYGVDTVWNGSNAGNHGSSTGWAMTAGTVTNTTAP